jgi:hypothetical protein
LNQAYSVIAAKKGVCGQFDLICIRNPWGSGEFTGISAMINQTAADDVWSYLLYFRASVR